MNKVTEEDIENFRALGVMGLYQRLATRFAVYPGRGTPLGLLYCALKLNGEAGELAEHAGKALRDDALLVIGNKANLDNCDSSWSFDAPLSYGELTLDRHDKLIKEIGDNLWYLAALCNELNTTLDAAALANLQKLASRTERGTLRGSGDDR